MYWCTYSEVSASAINSQTCKWNFFFCPSVSLIRDRIKSMFYHAYNNYLENAYPYDELRPLTCDGQDTWGRYVLNIVFSLVCFLKMPCSKLHDNIYFDNDDINLMFSLPIQQFFTYSYWCPGYLAGMNLCTNMFMYECMCLFYLFVEAFDFCSLLIISDTGEPHRVSTGGCTSSR